MKKLFLRAEFGPLWGPWEVDETPRKVILLCLGHRFWFLMAEAHFASKNTLLLGTLCFLRAEHTLQPNTLCKVTIYSPAPFALIPFAQKNIFLQIGLLQFAS